MSLLSRETQNKRSSRLDMTLRHLGVLQKEIQEIFSIYLMNLFVGDQFMFLFFKFVILVMNNLLSALNVNYTKLN